MKNDDNLNDNKLFKRLKIVFIGNSKTGKTTFLSKISDNYVDKDAKYIPTIGGSYASLKKEYKNGEFYLDFWDTSGVEKYYSLIKFFYNNADAILIFYDSYDTKSFEKAKKMLDDCKIFITKNPLIALVRSRYDEYLKINDDKNIVSDEEALEFADLNNIYFLHLSSFEKYENGVNELIKFVSKKLLNE